MTWVSGGLPRGINGNNAAPVLLMTMGLVPLIFGEARRVLDDRVSNAAALPTTVYGGDQWVQSETGLFYRVRCSCWASELQVEFSCCCVVEVNIDTRVLVRVATGQSISMAPVRSHQKGRFCDFCTVTHCRCAFLLFFFSTHCTSLRLPE